MRIAFLIQDLFQQGAQYVTALMIRGFIAKGYDVDLLVSKVHQDLLEVGEIRPFDIPVSTGLTILPARKARNNIRAIYRYISQDQPDAIVAMSSNYNLALALATLKLPKDIRSKCKIAYVEHSGWTGINTTTLQKYRPRLFSKGWLISKLFNHSFDVILGVSVGISRAIEYSMRRRKNTVITVYNPVIDDEFWRKNKNSSTHEWLLNKTMPTVIAAGAHCRIKNYQCLFEAIKIANKTTPVRLILFGKGDCTNEYRQWITSNNMQDRISIAGHSSNLPAEIKDADIFVCSSVIESFSIVIVEALAANVPVISTACPYGPPEILQEGKFGTLVPVNDAQAMADAIVSQIREPIEPAPKESWLPYTLENVVIAYEKALRFRV